MNSNVENEAYSIEQKKNFVEEYKKLPLKNSNSDRRVISIRKYATSLHIDESTFRSWLKNYEKGDFNDIPNADERKRARKSEYYDVEKRLGCNI